MSSMCVVNDCVVRRYMQIRYHFIGDLDTIVVDKSSAAPNFQLSALYGNCVTVFSAFKLHAFYDIA